MATDFNETHPELREGEILQCNVKTNEEFDEINFKSKRAGKVAYDYYGKVIVGALPVFVLRSELRERDRMRKKLYVTYKR